MNIKKILVFVFFFFSFNLSLYAEAPHYLDFKLILNESDAGKKAQNFLKKKLESGIENIKKKEKSFQEDEKKIIQQKKIITAEEYKKKVNELRKKVNSLQKERSTLLDTVAKQRSKARNELLKNLNPLIKDYMKQNKIRMVVDKKSLLLADENLDITKKIMTLLNEKIKTININ